MECHNDTINALLPPLTAIRHAALASTLPAGSSTAGCWLVDAARDTKERALVVLCKLRPTATASRPPADWMMAVACWTDTRQACTSSCREQRSSRLQHRREQRQQDSCWVVLAMQHMERKHVACQAHVLHSSNGGGLLHRRPPTVELGVLQQHCPSLPDPPEGW